MAHTYKEFDWYEVPLFYDVIFDGGTAEECDFLEAMYERYAPTNQRRVLEPACGTGRLVEGMAERGYLALGLDISPGSLAFARRRLDAWRARKGPEPAGSARVVRGDMASFRTRHPFELAHCLVSSFLYLDTEERARGHLECVARALVPGGVYVLGLHLVEYEHERLSRERWVAARAGVEVVCNIQSWPPEPGPRQRRMRSRLTVTRGGRVERYQTQWRFRTYDAAQLHALLASVPALEHVATHDFDLRADRTTQLGEERLDQVLVLRRRAP